MNFGLIISYVIAGMLMIIIVTIGYNTSFSGNELALQEIQKVKTNEVIEVITYDMPKIGYSRTGRPDTTLIRIDSNYVEFYANIDNSADNSIERVTWEFTTDSVTTTQNPNDYVLERTVDGVTSRFSAGITTFRINFYSELGGNTPVTVPMTAVANKTAMDNIEQIEIIMVSESEVPLQYNAQTNPRYVRTAWTKRFSPVNIRDN